MLADKMRPSLLFLLCTCMLLLSSCGTATGSIQSNSNMSSAPAANQSNSTSTSTSDATKTTNSPPANQAVTTDCPAPGGGRAAVMPALQPGKHRAIVFFSNVLSYTNHPSLTLKRYDVETGTTTTLLSQSGQNMYNAQLSGDGQWILFVAQTLSVSKMQLIRVDGRYLQTLYCAPQGQQVDPRNGAEGGYSNGVQWSPDQKQVIFTQGKQATLLPSPSLYLLNVQTGGIQVELTLTANEAYIQPQTWVDNTRVYVTSSGISLPHPPAAMFILDTSKGAHQHTNDLQLVLGVSDTLWNFDSTYDASKLLVVRFDPTPGRSGPGTFCQISSLSITGQNGKLIFNSSKIVVSDLRVLGYGSTSLLLSVNQAGSPGDQYNGIWKMKSDGTGLTRLTDQPGPFNSFTQYPWSNVARDGSLYLIGTFFGSINGGAITRYTSDASALPVGWTTF